MCPKFGAVDISSVYIYLSIHPSKLWLLRIGKASLGVCAEADTAQHSGPRTNESSRIGSSTEITQRNFSIYRACVVYIFLCQRLSVYDDLISKFFLRLPHTHIPPSPFCPNDDDDDFILYTDCAPVSWNFRWSDTMDGTFSYNSPDGLVARFRSIRALLF